MKLVITRAEESIDELTDLVTDKKFDLVYFPCLEYKTPSDNYAGLNKAIRENHLYDWLVFFSKYSAEVFFSRVLDLGANFFNLSPHLKIAVVGPKTAKFIREEVNFPVDFIPSIYNSAAFTEEFIAKFSEEGFIKGMDKKRLLLVRAELDDNIVDESFNNTEEFDLTTVLAYRTQAPSVTSLDELRSLLLANEDLFISFASGETVKNFKCLCSDLDFTTNNKLRFLSIGPKTSRAIREYFSELDLDSLLLEAKEPSFRSLFELVGNL
jgi:uroporphyrinogen-III synthase